MKKLMQLVIVLIVLIDLTGCKSKDTSISPPTQEASTDSVLQKIKETAQQITSSETANITGEVIQQAGQTVFVPIEQKAPDGTISPNYKSPCMVERYRGLNIYCRGKTFWHNQSTLLSWYIPYSLVLLILFILMLVLWWIKRNK